MGHVCHVLSLFDLASLYPVDITFYFGPTKYKITTAGTAYFETNGSCVLGLKDAFYCPDMEFTTVSKDGLLGIEGLVMRDSHERNSPCAFFEATCAGQLHITAEPTGTGHLAFDLPMTLPPTLRLGDSPAF